jgi:hypothetical protein
MSSSNYCFANRLDLAEGDVAGPLYRKALILATGLWNLNFLITGKRFVNLRLERSSVV